MDTVQLLMPAPIPVGNRVAVTWYLMPPAERGGWPQSVPNAPLVRDLDSGIQYGPRWLWAVGPVFQDGELAPVHPELRPDLEEEEYLTGVVAACQLAAVQIDGVMVVQTVLSVRPDESGGVYR